MKTDNTNQTKTKKCGKCKKIILFIVIILICLAIAGYLNKDILTKYMPAQLNNHFQASENDGIETQIVSEKKTTESTDNKIQDEDQEKTQRDTTEAQSTDKATSGQNTEEATSQSTDSKDAEDLEDATAENQGSAETSEEKEYGHSQQEKLSDDQHGDKLHDALASKAQDDDADKNLHSTSEQDNLQKYRKFLSSANALISKFRTNQEFGSELSFVKNISHPADINKILNDMDAYNKELKTNGQGKELKYWGSNIVSNFIKIKKMPESNSSRIKLKKKIDKKLNELNDYFYSSYMQNALTSTR